jgi:hypothetical protein
MNRNPRYPLAAVLAALALVFAGCGKTVQIVRAPFISPVVVPAPDVFKMNVAVKNYHESATSDHLWLRVRTEYWPTANPPQGQPPCTTDGYLDVGVLAPGESWGLADHQIGNSRCTCVKDACVGHVWLSLHIAPDYPPPIDGPNTALHVNWVPSGDLAQMTVEEF